MKITQSGAEPGLITVPPLASGATNGANLMAALLIGAVQLTGDAYLVNDVLAMTSNQRLVMHPKTVLYTTNAGSGAGDTNAMITGVYVVGAFSTTLAANTTAGSYTISLTAAPAVGSWIALSSAAATNVVEQFQVTAVSGAGPYTVTLDAPVQRASVFLSGKTVQGITPCINPRLEGNGAVMTGTWGRMIEFACVGGLISGINIDASRGMCTSIAMSGDTGTRGLTIINCNVDGGNRTAGATPCAAGIALECATSSRIIGCNVRNTAQTSSNFGYYLPDCYDCDIIACDSDGCGVGVGIGTDSNAPTLAGSHRVKIIGGAHNASAQYGVQIQTCDVLIDGVTCSNGANIGVYVGFGAGLTEPSGGPVTLRGVRTQGNIGVGLQMVGGNVDCIGCSFREDGSTGVYIVSLANAGNVTFTGCSWALSSDVAHYGFYGSGSGRVKFIGCRWDFPTSPAAASACVVLQGTHTASFTECNSVGGYFGLLYCYGTGNTVLWGTDNGIASAGGGGAYTVAGGSTSSPAIAATQPLVMTAGPTPTVSIGLFSLDLTLVGGTKVTASGKDLTNATLVGVKLKTPTTGVGYPVCTFVAGSNGNVTVTSYTAGSQDATDIRTYTATFIGAV